MGSCQLPSSGSYFSSSFCNARFNTNRSLSSFKGSEYLGNFCKYSRLRITEINPLILILLWQPWSFLIHSSAFHVVLDLHEFCFHAMMIFWRSSHQGVFLGSCSCCCTYTAWIYRWFVCDHFNDISYKSFPKWWLMESIHFAQHLISAIRQKHW